MSMSASNCNTIIIAVPLTQGHLCTHFGHCEKFGLFTVDTRTQTIVSQADVDPPPHEPGAIPRWLKEMGARVIIASGMGSRARLLFERDGIEVFVGADDPNPRALVLSYLSNVLESGQNPCDH